MLEKRVHNFSIGKGETPLLRMELILLYPSKLRIIKFVFLFISNSTYKHIKILIFRERKNEEGKMKKKEEVKGRKKWKEGEGKEK